MLKLKLKFVFLFFLLGVLVGCSGDTKYFLVKEELTIRSFDDVSYKAEVDLSEFSGYNKKLVKENEKVSNWYLDELDNIDFVKNEIVFEESVVEEQRSELEFFLYDLIDFEDSLEGVDLDRLIELVLAGDYALLSDIDVSEFDSLGHVEYLVDTVHVSIERIALLKNLLDETDLKKIDVLKSSLLGTHAVFGVDLSARVSDSACEDARKFLDGHYFQVKNFKCDDSREDFVLLELDGSLLKDWVFQFPDGHSWHFTESLSRFFKVGNYLLDPSFLFKPRYETTVIFPSFVKNSNWGEVDGNSVFVAYDPDYEMVTFGFWADMRTAFFGPEWKYKLMDSVPNGDWIVVLARNIFD